MKPVTGAPIKEKDGKKYQLFDRGRKTCIGCAFWNNECHSGRGFYECLWDTKYIWKEII